MPKEQPKTFKVYANDIGEKEGTQDRDRGSQESDEQNH